MKVQITVIDDKGYSYEGAIDLAPIGSNPKPNAKSKPQRKEKPAGKVESLSFAMNERAFMKKYGKGKSAHANFALLLARICGGEIGKEVGYEVVAQKWNTMKSILGGPLRAVYALRAKEKAWIDSPKRGVYVLTHDWRDVLGT